MPFKRLLPLLSLLVGSLALLGTRPAHAQEQGLLSLASSTTTMQTGQEYEVAIMLDNVVDVWVLNAEISYDPNLVYIMGAKAGHPVRQGPFFAPLDQSVVVRNIVQQPGLLVYTISMLAPAEPVSGSNVIGTFRVYPLAPGTAQLAFKKAEISSVTFTGTGSNRVASDPQNVPFTPALLDLTITGDPVEPPPEATATPSPIETVVMGGGVVQPGQEATLMNVTAVPRAFGGLPAPNEISPWLLVGAGFVAALVVMLITLAAIRKRPAS